ncbi:hypothetical protein [Halobacillus mangrovi]|uniref:Uncharacterized protein n=1 Tax=Halobacillus mangrovi TaxID=402384 RepID=A0A1W5ZYB9_9BACI|nr:hypothetical protein [Halobacillus mangrovi]ARI78227.1 hypothetical protein HM131_15820 [Halobacillus mangrovi]
MSFLFGTPNANQSILVLLSGFGKVLGWITLKIIGGLLIGISGFIGALLIYRYLNYHKILRRDIKDEITSFLRTCNGEMEKGTCYTINTKEHPDGISLDKKIYPTTKAITQRVRLNEELFDNNKWGFKYDEEFINGVLEEMLFEGCVSCLYNKDTHEIEGWQYSIGAERNEKVSYLSLRPVKVTKEGKLIDINKGKRTLSIHNDHIFEIGVWGRRIFIADSDRWVTLKCNFKWEANILYNKIENIRKEIDVQYLE